MSGPITPPPGLPPAAVPAQPAPGRQPGVPPELDDVGLPDCTEHGPMLEFLFAGAESRTWGCPVCGAVVGAYAGAEGCITVAVQPAGHTKPAFEVVIERGTG